MTVVVEARTMTNFDRVSIKYGGEHHEFQLSELDLPMTEDGRFNPTDVQVRTAVMTRLAAPNLDGFVVDPPESERLADRHIDKTILVVRPSATYGN